MSASSVQDLTQAIESIQEKVKAANSERHQLVTQLQSVIASAQQLLGELGADAKGVPRRRGRPTGSGRKRGRPKGSGKKRRKMTAAGRRAISVAQKARWAKIKAEKKK